MRSVLASGVFCLFLMEYLMLVNTYKALYNLVLGTLSAQVERPENTCGRFLSFETVSLLQSKVALY